MKYWMLIVVVLALSACSAGGQPQAGSAELQDMGPAPELTNEVWLNTDTPLRLKDLRGTVVAIDLWTFNCINCIHALPQIREWYSKYKSRGFEIIGVHYPETPFEADWNNVTTAVADLQIEYPVAQDNDGAMWNAYRGRAWPTLYLIDKRGNIRYQHIGEGAYKEIAKNIETLLAEPYTEGS